MKEETFIITIVSSPPMPPPRPPPPPPPLGALKCPAFSTHLKPPLALLDAARLSSNLRAPANPLHCSSPVSASPLNGLTLCREDGGVVGGQRKEDGGEKAEWRASGCKGECTWMGRLPGHAVRGYCPACQQPLAFNGARISSF